MPRRDPQVQELRRLLRSVLRGLWRRRRPPADLEPVFMPCGPPLGPRHMGLLVHVGTEGERTVGELAEELGLSLPAASAIARDLEEHNLVHRREAIEDKRRTIVDLNALTEKRVRSWLDRRDAPLRKTLAALDPAEREAFLKGLRALAEALMEESPRGPLRPHHWKAHRRRSNRDRSV